jgi:hypothetical protein
MRNRHEVSSFNEHDWTCVKLDSPLGAVMLARKVPVVWRSTRWIGVVSNSIIRRFASNSPPGLTTRRFRWRR